MYVIKFLNQLVSFQGEIRSFTVLLQKTSKSVHFRHLIVYKNSKDILTILK